MNDDTMQIPSTIQGYFTVRHKARANGQFCTDHTEWLVIEESRSFFIVQGPVGGYTVKLKDDYELASRLEPVSP